MIDAPTLDFTAHCQVRYIERFLDKDAVLAARRQAKGDAEILDMLRPAFDDDLRHFRHVVQVGYFHLLHKAGKFVEGSAYRLNLGPISVCIEGNLCKTTVCKHYSSSRPDPTDDDPMEESSESEQDEALVA